MTDEHSNHNVPAVPRGAAVVREGRLGCNVYGGVMEWEDISYTPPYRLVRNACVVASRQNKTSYLLESTPTSLSPPTHFLMNIIPVV